MATNPTAQNDPLAALRDIQPPEPAGWWPPAPGWWLLAIVVLLAIGWLTRKAWQARQKRRRLSEQQRWLMAELNRIEQQATEQPRTAAQQLSQLLRRCAIKMQQQSFDAEKPVAGLQGDEWLEWLENHGGKPLSAHRHWLLEAPFSASSTAPPATLFEDCRIFFRSAALYIARPAAVGEADA